MRCTGCGNVCTDAMDCTCPTPKSTLTWKEELLLVAAFGGPVLIVVFGFLLFGPTRH